MDLLCSTFLSENCDYSFGAYTSPNSWDVKTATLENLEFINKCDELKKEKKVVTLFIDNLRLYRRTINIDSIFTNMEESPTNKWEEHKNNKIDLFEKYKNEDLLFLCSQIQDLKFVIFTGFDDINLDEEIFDRIPKNVLKIYAVSASEYFNTKVIPFPFGLPRKLNDTDNRHSVLIDCLNYDIEPSYLLHINHSLGSNPFRQEINNFFENYSWCDIRHPTSINDVDYKNYLDGIKQSKFILNVDGNAKNCDCYRVWESLYMKRVPIVLKSKNFQYLFQDLPVLLVNNFNEIDERFLQENIHIYEKINNFDINKLDIKKIYNNILKEFEYLEIVDWLREYATKENMNLIIGISGGVDSAVTSTLCALTNLKTYVVSLPIKQNEKQLMLAEKHISWLVKNFDNVESIKIDLTTSFDVFIDNVNSDNIFNNKLSLANTKSRLRMVTLYHLATNLSCLVVGTGNKIEDFGIGFFTKYGDGGVDISPIADLTKSEVFDLAKILNIDSEIIQARPTDGLWDDDRCDEDQIGTTYKKLEWAMDYVGDENELNDEDKKVLEIYKNFNKKNKHKMIPIPVYLKKQKI